MWLVQSVKAVGRGPSQDVGRRLLERVSPSLHHTCRSQQCLRTCNPVERFLMVTPPHQ